MANFLFTVDANGKKVEFSPGNLYWNGSSFDFEENDYDYPTSWSTSHVGHFFWSKSKNVAIASSYSDGSESTSDTFFAANGGAIEGWTVLSEAEWNYVISNHLGKNQVSINGKNCVVLVPDGVSTSVVESSYTASAWTAAKEQFGLVALPFAGDRDDTSFYGGGSYGYYWSGTPHSGGASLACCAYFDSSGAYADCGSRYYGYSVRLVKVV